MSEQTNYVSDPSGDGGLIASNGARLIKGIGMWTVHCPEHGNRVVRDEAARAVFDEHAGCWGVSG